MAYELAGDEEEQAATIAYLEEREKQYDQRHRCNLITKDGDHESNAVEGCLVYVASQSEKNKNWLGPASLDHIATTISTSIGPSGPNFEYLFGLADAMRDLGIAEDEELFELEALVRTNIDIRG